MKNLDLMTEAGALGGYTVGSTGTDATNKARAQRRINIIKADLVSRYGGHWPASYREGWLAVTPLYTTGTVTVTQASNTVTGVSTAWTTAMKNYKFIAPDGSVYKVASVASSTSLILSQPYQGSSASAQSYSLWQDEYTLHPDVMSIGGFVDYNIARVLTEAWPKNMKDSYPKETANQNPDVFQVTGRAPMSASYSTGTVSGTINTTTLTGAGTSWLANVYPGYAITIGTATYHVRNVNSDTEIELYQMLATTVASLTTYTAVGKNSLVVRFRAPATQRIVNYWYYAKDYPFVNDSDEDWIAEMFPNVVLSGLGYWDYIDKKDLTRIQLSKQAYENAIKDMRVAVLNAYTGTRTIGLNIPESARE